MTVRRAVVLSAILLLLFLMAVLAGPPVLRRAGHLLVHSDPLQKADFIIVLGGDWKGERVLAACELMKQGVARTALISGPTDIYGRNEGDLAIDYARRKGCPDGLLEPAYMKAFSTQEEAVGFQRELERRHAGSVLVVTSNYHTARARRLFRRQLGSGVDVRAYAAPEAFFDPDHWWESRESQKTTFYEWSKTVAEVFGL